MDFTPEPEQQAVADVVRTVLDRENTWEALVSGGVTALGVPEREVRDELNDLITGAKIPLDPADQAKVGRLSFSCRTNL